jgi:2-polyprenyl-3-methyl-5-hydroxy-6-metoxy-1,4-benzoquinol methylase
MEVNAQTFWLENLKHSSQYNCWIFEQILPHLGQNVLEVGCGNGNFTSLLVEQVHQVMAVDLNPDYVAATQNRLPHSNLQVLHANALEMSWEQTFDTIIMLDVLEHITDDQQCVQRLYQYLQPGGKLLIKVPAMQGLYGSLDQAIGHHRRYTHATLETLFQQSHFKDMQLWYFNALGILGWWLNGKLLRRTVPHSEQVGLFDRLVPVLRKLEAPINLPFGLSLFVVATKI